MGLKDAGPVKIAIIIYCGMVLFEILYIIYRISCFIYGLIIWRTKDVVSKPFYVGLSIVLGFFSWIFSHILVFLTAVFLLFYLIWKVMNKIGLGMIVSGTPFNECVSTGLFPFFDKLFDILWGSETFGLRIRSAGLASSTFLKTFMKEAFGLVFEGYEIDDEYLTAAFNVFLFNSIYADDPEKCLDAKQKFLEVTKQKTPVIKIVHNDVSSDRQLTETENIKVKNCIRENTVEIPNDASTIERLQLIFSNAVAKQKCYLDIKNNTGDCSAQSMSCMIADMENAAKNIGNNISLSSVTSFSNSASSATKYYDSSVATMENSQKK